MVSGDGGGSDGGDSGDRGDGWICGGGDIWDSAEGEGGSGERDNGGEG